MLLQRLGLAVLAAAAALVRNALADEDDNPSGQSTFVSPDDSVAFALTVPDHNQDIYFAIRMANRLAWAGIGLGSDDMPGALYLIIYRNEAGDNVTFSPRLSTTNTEPRHFPDLEYDVLNGTGVRDDYTYFYARCTAHCRSWPAGGTSRGYIDVSDSNQHAIYAAGPRSSFGSDSPSASLKFHSRFGAFTIDMRRTQGSADPPVLTEDSATSGAEGLMHRERQVYWIAVVHGIFMVFAFALLFPQGVLMLRIFGWVKWHAVNQMVSSVFVFVGLVLGILASRLYQRSMHFDSAHQILGIIIVATVISQLVLGFLHHKKHQTNQGPSRYGQIHIWVGRVMLLFGLINAFAGFFFALEARYAGVLAGILMFIFIGCAVLMWLNSRRPGAASRPLTTYSGYQHPQRHNYQDQQPSPQPQYPAHELQSAPPYNPGPSVEPIYEADSNPIHMPASPWRSQRFKDDDVGAGYDAPVKPREFT
ncbi:hypothetical protein S40288_06071 [Stachybotrys chartarum IBT 40288]|nr:hypothetical protein S40288_06071 [Stachybotrys chartarum IBT 40288]